MYVHKPFAPYQAGRMSPSCPGEIEHDTSPITLRAYPHTVAPLLSPSTLLCRTALSLKTSAKQKGTFAWHDGL